MKERWYLQTKKADFNEISRKFNISPILARLLRNRNVIGDENIKKYLSPDIERLSSPWMFKDMDKAVDILKIKIAAGNRIELFVIMMWMVSAQGIFCIDHLKSLEQ